MVFDSNVHETVDGGIPDCTDVLVAKIVQEQLSYLVRSVIYGALLSTLSNALHLRSAITGDCENHIICRWHHGGCLDIELWY